MPKGVEHPQDLLFHILHLRDVQRLSFGQIADRIGMTRSAIAALIRQINMATDKHDHTPHMNVIQPYRGRS